MAKTPAKTPTLPYCGSRESTYKRDGRIDLTHDWSTPLRGLLKSETPLSDDKEWKRAGTPPLKWGAYLDALLGGMVEYLRVDARSREQQDS